MIEPRWLDERQAHVWQAYLHLNQHLYAALEDQLERDAGLSGVDYKVLVPLSEAPMGVLRARELCTEIGWDRSRLSHHVRRMEKRGLVAREECADDGRGSMVRLTAAGRSAIEGAAPQHAGTTRRYFFDLLSDSELATLSVVFDRLLENLTLGSPAEGASMTTSIPTIVSEYLAASDGGDVEAVVRCFDDDAVVFDEDREWRGQSAIREWRETVATAYEYTVEVRGAAKLGPVDDVERHEVYTHLEGNFPGGVVDLTYRFELRDGRIARLEIVPTEMTRL